MGRLPVCRSGSAIISIPGIVCVPYLMVYEGGTGVQRYSSGHCYESCCCRSPGRFVGKITVFSEGKIWVALVYVRAKAGLATIFKLSVVNKQTESHRGLIFYLHEVELLYNDVHHSQPTL